MRQVKFYITNNGNCPYLDWFKSLDKSTSARIDSRIVRLLEGNYGEHKKIDANISELKFKFGSGYRIYYTEKDEIITILLCAGDKKTQVKDIKIAKKYFEEMKGNFYER